MSEQKYTEKFIQERLNGFFASGSIRYNVDNLYVFGWESDKLLWTKSGNIYEFEIKISRADFKNDFKHKPEKHIILGYDFSKELLKAYEQDLFAKEFERHQWLGEEEVRKRYNAEKIAKGRKKPNFFYYAVPKGLIDVEDIPEYAGLIWIDGQFLTIQKKAPCLHKEKYTDTQLGLSEKFYYNWQSTKQTLKRATQNREYYQNLYQKEVDKSGHECSWEELKAKLKAEEEKVSLWQREARVKAQLYLTMVEGADYNNLERRMLINKIKEYNPNFDYAGFMKDVEEEYEKRYPKRR